MGGLNHRDQMVGPWQVPVADCAVTLADYVGFRGEAMSMGERTPLAALDAPASGRMAVAEALTNLLAAPFELERVKLSCNWMAACGEPGEDAALYETVKAVGMDLCPALGISVPVGKDSLSMRTRWAEGGEQKQVVAPVSLVVTAFATLADVRGTLTPQLQRGDTTLDPGGPGPGPPAHGRLDAGPGAAAVRPRGARPGRPGAAEVADQRGEPAAWRRQAAGPTTTAATAACGQPPARWPLPATWASA